VTLQLYLRLSMESKEVREMDWARLLEIAINCSPILVVAIPGVYMLCDLIDNIHDVEE